MSVQIERALDKIERHLAKISSSLDTLVRQATAPRAEPSQASVSRQEFEELKRYVSNVAAVAQRADQTAGMLRPIGGRIPVVSDSQQAADEMEEVRRLLEKTKRQG